jgi:hypothetical protein
VQESERLLADKRKKREDEEEKVRNEKVEQEEKAAIQPVMKVKSKLHTFQLSSSRTSSVDNMYRKDFVIEKRSVGGKYREKKQEKKKA